MAPCSALCRCTFNLRSMAREMQWIQARRCQAWDHHIFTATAVLPCWEIPCRMEPILNQVERRRLRNNQRSCRRRLYINYTSWSPSHAVEQQFCANFLSSMLEDQTIQHLITWSSSNDSFLISPSAEFSKVLAYVVVQDYYLRTWIYGVLARISNIPTYPPLSDSSTCTVSTKVHNPPSSEQKVKADVNSERCVPLERPGLAVMGIQARCGKLQKRRLCWAKRDKTTRIPPYSDSPRLVSDDNQATAASNGTTPRA